MFKTDRLVKISSRKISLINSMPIGVAQVEFVYAAAAVVVESSLSSSLLDGSSESNRWLAHTRLGLICILPFAKRP